MAGTGDLYAGAVCPGCGDGRLVRRTARKDNHPFFGCSCYPGCKFTADLPGQERAAAPAETEPERPPFEPTRTVAPADHSEIGILRQQVERMAVRLGALNSEVAELHDQVKRLERANKKLQAGEGGAKPPRKRGGRRRSQADAIGAAVLDKEFNLICG